MEWFVVRSIIAVGDDQPWSEQDGQDFVDWAAAVVRRETGVLGAEVETVLAELHARHTRSAVPPSYCGLLSLWCDPALPHRIAGELPRGRARVVTVRDRLRINYERTWPDGARTPGVKKTTFWFAAAGCSDWRARYDRHAEVVATCHHSAWRYRQNLVLADLSGDAVCDAVSELWWPDASGLIDHFYADDRARQEVARDAVFVDRGRAWPIVTRHTVLRTPPERMAAGHSPALVRLQRRNP